MTAVTSSQMLWYTTRATGVVALVLLTGAMVLGVFTSVRLGTRNWPRFAFQDLHRRISLLAVAFVAMHVVTTVSDSFAPIGWVSVFVPFTSSYRRLWVGLGTVGVDLLLAVTISSLVRQKINPRTWRALHWLAYASWPLAVVHGLGTGTDPHVEWMILLVVGCVAAVLAAAGWRLVAGWPARASVRVTAGATSVVAVIGLAAWTAAGPLRPGWALRAGTPPSLLATSPAKSTGTPSTNASPPVNAVTANLPAPPYSAALTGSVSQRYESDGSVQLDIHARTSGTLDALLDVIISGTPDGTGGVVMDQSGATFGPQLAPAQYQGRIVGLDGSQMTVTVVDRNGNRIDLHVDVAISGSQMTGQLTAARGTGNDGSFGDDH